MKNTRKTFSDEAWERGELGQSEEHVQKVSSEGSVANFNFSDKIYKIFSKQKRKINFRQNSSVKLDHFF